MASDTEITKVRIVIRHLLWQIREVRNDRDAAWKWVNRFANTLQYQDLEQDPDQYALAILAEARSFNDQKKRNGQMKWVREQLAKEGVTSPTQEQLDEKWLEMYGNETTADGDTREDYQDVHDGSNSGTLESGTSANLYGDASHSEAEDESATVSNNSEARQSRRTGAPSTGATSSTAPVRSGRKFRNKEDFIQWAIDDGLDPVDANECWEATEERGGKDADGNTVKNMKAFARQWCRTRKDNRRTA